ncbi:MAG: dephospho-CoA kinase [Chloroflexaceae bacterium]|nr:dephospho-CoA kinase [Chloroflexaceae bacterium]
MSDLYVIGLTGNIACGKSTVVAMLRDLGAQTIDADQITHALQQPGTAVYRQIIETFGEAILDPATDPAQRPINRRKLGAIVFNNTEQLRRLEAIVHPAVRAAMLTWLHERRNEAAQHPNPATVSVAVIDAVKLLEGGWRQYCNAVWVIICDEAQQVARLTTTRGMSTAEAMQRIRAQPPQATRAAQGDVIIDNSGTLAATREQVAATWQRIQQHHK